MTTGLKNSVKCQLCGNYFKQITGTHLRKAHNMTFTEYKALFPESETLSSNARQKIIDHAVQMNADGVIGFKKGHTVNAGKVPWNKGIHGVLVSPNKGKTKENYSPLAIAGEKVSEKRKQMFKDGLLIRPAGKLNPMYGKVGWNKGKTKKDCPQLKAISEKISVTRKQKIKDGTIAVLRGKDNPMYGKKLTEQHRNALWGGWKHSGTKPELKMRDLLSPYSDWEYTANGKFYIRTEIKCRIPDFVNKRKKKIIEIYGDYWHRGENPQDKIDEYNKVGWECVVVWEHEVMDDSYSIESLSNYL